MLSELNPFIRFAGLVSAEIFPDEPYFVSDSRLFLCRRGSAVITLAGESYKISAGSLVYIPPYVLYGFSDFSEDEDFVIIALNFDFDQSRCQLRNSVEKHRRDSMVEREQLYIPAPFSTAKVLDNGSFISEELDGMVSLFFHKEKYYRDMASAYMKQAMLKLLGAERGATDTAVGGVIKYIAENYSQRISNSQIARRFNYHPNHLNRMMKNHTGHTLKDYLIRYRIRVAKRLLTSTGMTVTEISGECGFSTPSYFSETFFRLEKMTPREYRTKILSSVI